MRAFFQRLAIVPFEAMIAALVVFSGLVDLTHVGGLAKSTLDLLLPRGTVVVLDLMYAVSGASMLWGIGRGKARPEGFGITLLVAGVLVRAVALVAVARWSSVVLTVLFFDLLVILGCVARLRTLLEGDVIVQVRPE